LVPKELHEYLKVFEKKASERMPIRKPWDHAIETVEGYQAKKSKIYPTSPEEQKEISDFLTDQTRKGYIRPSKSPQTSPVFFVGKKDGKKRMVQDYRYLNENTIKNNYPLPLIGDLVDKVGKAKLFTKLDLRWGYNNIRIKEGDEWKAAFTTPFGSFEPLVMYFGLTNSPATFQTMMNEIFKDMIHEGKIVVYIDDILIYTDTMEGHVEIVKEVLKRLEENDLFVKPEKCSFWVEEVEFLGMIIGKNGIRMSPDKVDAVLKWPVPRKVREVQQFLGLANYYRRFIQAFASIAKPLHNLVKKDQQWRWARTEQKAFDELKRKFTEAPLLVPPDTTKRFRVESDASDYATGGVLSQEGDDGKWRPVAYLSKSLNDAERNYDVHDKELLGVIRCLDAWRHYLEGCKHKFEIWTDHKNLEYFTSAKKLNRRQARWSLFLTRFEFALVHKAGATMGKADSLSRRPDHKEGVQDDNKDVVMLKPEVFTIRALQQGHVLINGEENRILKKIRNAKDHDESVVKAVEEMKKAGIKILKEGEWQLEQDLVLTLEKYMCQMM
jgi:hypothetical protein